MLSWKVVGFFAQSREERLKICPSLCSNVSRFLTCPADYPKRQCSYEFKHKADGNNNKYQGELDKIKFEFIFKIICGFKHVKPELIVV